MDTIKINKSNTLMVAHRGLSGLEPENTMAAFIAAANRDYFGIETDVHVTADGQFVVIHDDDTGRVAAEKISVEQSTLAQLQQIHLNDKNGQPRSDLRIPTLAEYLQVCARYDKTAVLELKNAFAREHIEKMLEVVRANITDDRIIFISFDYNNMKMLRELLPEATLQFLTADVVDDALIAQLKAHRLDLDIYFSRLTEETIALLHANDIRVNCWTVDNPVRAENRVRWGVDFITSNILQ
jgi:glycerophosphoryl diester phosphodiesterase